MGYATGEPPGYQHGFSTRSGTAGNNRHILDNADTRRAARLPRRAARFHAVNRKTSYHLRKLAEQGFVEKVPEKSDGRERWWRALPAS
jgi:hypothetical protein